MKMGIETTMSDGNQSSAVQIYNQGVIRPEELHAFAVEETKRLISWTASFFEDLG